MNLNKFKLFSNHQPYSKLPAIIIKQNSTINNTTHFGFEKVEQEEKKDRVKTVFINVATKYDLMNDVMSMGIHRLWKDYYTQKLKIHKNSKIIDMAGGTGDIAFRLFEKMEKKPGNGSVTVVDINENMLEIGKIRAAKLYGTKAFKNRLNWAIADAESLPFEDNSFDLYTIAFGIRNCTHVDKVLAEAYRVLKPKGVFSCLEFSKVNKPIFKQIYDLYSLQMIPVLGQILVGDFRSYKYLVESIRVFPNQIEFSSMIQETGFKNVLYEDLNFGICTITSGIK